MSDAPVVELGELLFTMSWEDPALDRAAFRLSPGARVAIVASGGCNALTMLLDDPAEVYAFDYNATQVWMTELKRLAIRELDDDALFELLGLRPSDRRAVLLDRLLPLLPPEGAAWWRAQPWALAGGILGGGRYERFVGLFQRLLRFIQGRRRVQALLEDRDVAGRHRFYDEEWDRWPWRLLFRAFFNKTVLSRRGLSPEYFTFDDGSASFAESFQNRARRALRDLPVASNPFVSQYLLGTYAPGALPDYLRPEHLPTIRARIDRLVVRQGDVRTVFDAFPDATFDAISLSNVFELMSQSQADEVLPGVARVLRPGGRMTLRNLMIPRQVPPSLAHLLRLDPEQSRVLLEQDRSFVYRSVQVYDRLEAP